MGGAYLSFEKKKKDEKSRIIDVFGDVTECRLRMRLWLRFNSRNTYTKIKFRCSYNESAVFAGIRDRVI